MAMMMLRSTLSNILFKTANRVSIFKSTWKSPFQSTQRAPHTTNSKEEYNEPGGYLFGRKPGDPWNLDLTEKLYMIFYLGGIAAFFFLYQYKPDTDSQAWAKKVALKRIKDRGVDLESFRYQLPKI